MATTPAPSPHPPEQPTLTLRTLTRGDGLLGMRKAPGLGPRGAQLTVAIAQDAGSADSQAALAAAGLLPLPAKAVQWRHRKLAQQVNDTQADAAGVWWTLPEEAQFGDFWVEQVPRLQALGWRIVVLPGFAHISVPVQRWHLLIDPATGDERGRVLPQAAAGLQPQDVPMAQPGPLQPLRQPRRQGSWLLSLGVEVDGDLLDLTPMLATLLRGDARWLQPDALAAIDDEEIIVLRAPGGRRIEARAAPLKAIVGSMLDVLLAPHRKPEQLGKKPGALLLSSWDAQRVEAVRARLAETQAARAGPHGAWQLQGDAGLTALAARLRHAGSPPPVAQPAGITIKLRGYQLQGLAWLQYLREHKLAGILADDMGLGKTAQVLAHLLVEQQAGRMDQPALVVLPTSLVANWQNEAARHAPGLRVLTLHGPQRKRDFARIAQHDLVLTTYPLLWRDLDALKPQPWHLLVLDEAQLVKNAGSRAASAARRLQVRHRLCVTGTPLENNLAELWAHFDWLMPGFLGDARTFNRLWRKPIEENGEAARAELLAQRVRPFILRRRKQDVAAELPALTDVVRRVALQGRQRALYESVRVAADELVRKVLNDSDLRNRQIAILDALLKLRQVCVDPRLLSGKLAGKVSGRKGGAGGGNESGNDSGNGSRSESGNDSGKGSQDMEHAKLDLLLQMLPALVAEGHRVLVFSQFAQMLALVQAELDAIALPHLVLTGRTPPAKRGALIASFQAGAAPVLLASLKAGGVGLNLTAADTVIHLDPWWNPAVQDQATARAHRIGQQRPVFVYRLVAEGSIEERMLALQARKAALAASVLGADGPHAAKFDAAELRELLAPLQ